MLRILAAASALLCCACGGSTSAPTAAAPTPSPTPTATRAAGGLVGAIDQARLLSVCENARQADTVLQTGIGTSQADEFLTAAARLLEQPPVDPAAQAVGHDVRRALAAHHPQQAVTALTTFCRARTG